MFNRFAVGGVALLLVVGLPSVWAQEKPAAPQSQPAASQPANGFSVELTPVGGEIRPAVAMTFEAQLKDAAGKPVTDPSEMPDHNLAAIFVASDLSWFAHQHPEFGADGRFKMKVTFPQPGKYHVYYSFMPDKAGWHPAPGEVTVAGPAPAAVPLKADADTPKEVDGYKVTLQDGPPLFVGRESNLTFTVARGVNRLATLQAFFGASAHLFLVSQDLKNFVHVFPVDQPGGAASGPDFAFELRFPTPGLYRGWFMFQHKERIVPVPFTFDISDVQPRK